MSDAAFMQRALDMARARLGRTAPNPSVGCVIVRDGVVIAEAATAPGGRPHAETQALGMADAMGADVYVTLEPCAHHGLTPPCVDAVIAAKPSRVIIAVQDPDPRTAGIGVRKLQAAGIKVEIGEGAAQAQAINAGFFKRLATGMPLVRESADGQGFDAAFIPQAGEDLADALARMGRAGLTRVWVARGAELARALKAQGLLDL